MARRMLEENKRQQCGYTPDFKPVQTFNTVTILKEMKLEKQLGGTFSLQFNHDASELVAGFNGGGIKLFNPKTATFVRDLKPNRHGGVAVMALKYHPKTTDPSWLFAATAEGHIYVIDTKASLGEGKPSVVEVKNEINAMDFNSDGYTFATCGKDRSLRVYDTKTCKDIRTYTGLDGSKAVMNDPDVEGGNTKRVFALKFTDFNENILLTAGWDNHVKIWDIRTNDGIKRQIAGPHVCGDALDMDQGKILTGSWSVHHSLQEWDYGEGRLLKDITFPHKQGAYLYCAQFGDLGVVMAGGSGTNSVEVIEAATDRLVGSVPMTNVVQAMDCVLGGRYIAVGGKDLYIKLAALS
ncbi:hypothetical protein ACOMHN_044850 [Nucella lapillus]